MKLPRHLSLRQQLLWGILTPIVLFVLVDTISLYRQALSAVNVAYDRTLLASSKAIGELLEITGEGEHARIQATLPYTALEAFEADNRSRMFYRVSDANGQWLEGTQELPMWRGKLPDQGPYAALVDFYDDELNGEEVRVAVLLQPVATGKERAMATVQVAETLELRRTLARQILFDTLQRQALLVAVIILVVLLVVQSVTRPVRKLAQAMDGRNEDDLTPVSAEDLPREVQPLADATNQVMRRLEHLLDNQKRFVRDAAHQLRTPLAVLKVQVQSARRGDMPAEQALQDIESTTDRATALANQMLALAKVEQLRQQQDFSLIDWAETVRFLALDLSPLIAEKDIDFELLAQPCLVRAHDWMLRELVRNLLHNAIRFTPPHASLKVMVEPLGTDAILTISDSGPGIGNTLRQHLFEPFSTEDSQSGSGLGLTIAREIAAALGGQINLENRVEDEQIHGLDAIVRLPLHPNRPVQT